MNELDLHGNNVHEAWKLFTDHVAKCYFDNIKSTIIITGLISIAKLQDKVVTQDRL